MKISKKRKERKRKGKGFQKFRLHFSPGSKPLTSVPIQTTFPSRMCNTTPTLPADLKFILKEFGEDHLQKSNLSKQIRKGNKTRTSIKQRMNSFMGFRAFYTRDINAYETQIHLSKSLQISGRRIINCKQFGVDIQRSTITPIHI